MLKDLINFPNDLIDIHIGIFVGKSFVDSIFSSEL